MGEAVMAAQEFAGQASGLYASYHLKNDTKRPIYAGFHSKTIWIQPGETKELGLTAGTYFKLRFEDDDDDKKITQAYNNMDSSTKLASRVMAIYMRYKVIKVEAAYESLLEFDGSTPGYHRTITSVETMSNSTEFTTDIKAQAT